MHRLLVLVAEEIICTMGKGKMCRLKRSRAAYTRKTFPAEATTETPQWEWRGSLAGPAATQTGREGMAGARPSSRVSRGATDPAAFFIAHPSLWPALHGYPP
jgi:hypothetical protein